MSRDDETTTDAGPQKGQPTQASPSSEGSGPTAPGHPDPAPENGPESGGYDRRGTVRSSNDARDNARDNTKDNAKGGYGAG